jgi:serine/threonine protein kinase
LIPGTLINARYRIVQSAGPGGLGTVYEAVDLRLGATVAVKHLLVAVSGGPTFDQQVRIVAALRHPMLPVVSDYVRENDTAFLVMHFIHGADLATLLAQRGTPFPADDALGG